jgi:hypothetical protein
MDVITLAMAKAYSDEKGGYVEYRKIFEETYHLGEPKNYVIFDGDLVGLKVVNYSPNRRIMAKELKQPTFETGVGIYKYGDSTTDKMVVDYDNANGALTKPALFISGALNAYCPLVFHSASAYNCLAYFYEETSDNLGMGMTFSKGWYAVSNSTFANTPFDAEETPFVTHDTFEGAEGDYRAYFHECFPLTETISFTIGQDSIHQDSDYTFASFVKNFHNYVDGIDETSLANALHIYCSIRCKNSELSSNCFREGDRVTVNGKVIVPIDPKFLPKVEIHLQDYGVNLYAALLDPSHPTEFENQQLYDVFSNACASDKDIILCCGAVEGILSYKDVRIYLTQISKATNGTYQGAGKVLVGAGSGEATWATVTIETRETNGLLWIAVHLD